MFTGICYRRNSQEIAEGPYFLEVDAANADQFDESNIYLPIYISTLLTAHM